MPHDPQTLTSSDIIAIAAAAIALCAFVTTVWQGLIARQHNRLSVRPHLDWESRRRGENPYRLTLVNNGLGTAIVTFYSIILDGVEYRCESSEDMRRLHKKAAELPYDIQWLTFEGNTPISVGQRLDLIKFDADLNTADGTASAYALLDRIGMLIRYESMYGEHLSLLKSGTHNPAAQ